VRCRGVGGGEEEDKALMLSTRKSLHCYLKKHIKFLVYKSQLQHGKGHSKSSSQQEKEGCGTVAGAGIGVWRGVAVLRLGGHGVDSGSSEAGRISGRSCFSNLQHCPSVRKLRSQKNALDPKQQPMPVKTSQAALPPLSLTVRPAAMQYSPFPFLAQKRSSEASVNEEVVPLPVRLVGSQWSTKSPMASFRSA